MYDVLSPESLDAFYNEGFVRTGIQLSDRLLDRIQHFFGHLPPSSSNWSYFRTRCLSHYDDLAGWQDLKSRAIRKFAPWIVHRQVRRDIYNKSIYGSSEILPAVLEACLARGLARHLGTLPLLVGHDIYLENSGNKRTVGFHHDGFGWEIFYQTGDDLTLYIPLQDLSADSGGRLFVERHPQQSSLHGDRNQFIKRFGDYCATVEGTTDFRGLVTRENILASPQRKQMAKEFKRLINGRYLLSPPSQESMRPVNAARGEVILFNNKYFHAIEPLNADICRKIYVVRLFPLYNTTMAPPATFLNRVPCNRFLLNGDRATVEAIDPERASLPFCELPSS